MIGGGVLAVAVTAAAWKLRPPRDTQQLTIRVDLDR